MAWLARGTCTGGIQRSRDRANAIGENFQEVADLTTQLRRLADPLQDLIGLVDRLTTATQNGKQHEAQAMLAALKYCEIRSEWPVSRMSRHACSLS